MRRLAFFIVLLSVAFGGLVPKTGNTELDGIVEKTERILSQEELIWFRAGEFSVYDGPENKIMPELSGKGAEADYDYFIVKFSRPVSVEEREEIIYNVSDIEPAARTFYYVPNYAWIFRLPSHSIDDVRSMPLVDGVFHLPPYFKIYPKLDQILEGEDPDGMIEIKVQIFQGENYLELADLLKDSFDLRIVHATEGANHEYVIFETAPEFAREAAIFAANWRGTEWVERYFPNKPTNDWSRWITQSYDTDAMGLGGDIWQAQIIVDETVPIYRRGIYGQNQIVGYCDSGLDTLSIFYYDPDNDVPKWTGWEAPDDLGHRKIRAYNRGSDWEGDFDDTDTDMHGHGTHVGGSIAGDNPANDPSYGIYDMADGMAPLARLTFTDGANGPEGIYTPPDMNTMFGFARNTGAFIHSNSYGNNRPNYYNTGAQECDEFMYYYTDFIIFFAAGNDNNDSPPSRVAVYNCAKNIVSVGASETGFGSRGDPWGVEGTGENADLEDMAIFSSHGPTDEGLLKPNITVPGGWNIWSADNVDGGSAGHEDIRLMGGTSMACPTAAGITALIRQYYREGYYPSGSLSPSDEIYPSGALLKATLIAATRNMTGDHTTDTPGDEGHMNAPSNGQGWGRVVLDDALYFNDEYGEDRRKLWTYDTPIGFFDTGDLEEFFFHIDSDATEPIKVVLSWSDYPGSPAAGTPGVNDLDLIVDIDGIVYRGNHFTDTLSRSTTGGTADRINRDEVVWIDPEPGASMRVSVEGAIINSGPQPYAIVVVGEISEGEPNDRPEEPELMPFPFDNARLPNPDPSFSWLVPGDGDGDSIHFIFEFDSSSSFLFPIARYSTEDEPEFFFGGGFPVPEGTGDEVGMDLPILVGDGSTLWWRIRAYDGISYSRWTEPRSFTVDFGDTSIAWFQTTSDQFDNSTLVEANTDSNRVSISGISYRIDDNFESYENKAALEAEWTGYSDDYYDLSTSESVSGTQSVLIHDDSWWSQTSLHRNFTPLSEGYAETWCKTMYSTDQCFILTLYEGDNRKTQLYFREEAISIWDGEERHNLEPIVPGIWRYYRLDFSCLTNEVYVTIDDEVYGPFTFSGICPADVNQAFIGTHLYNNFTCETYFDDYRIAAPGRDKGTFISDPIIPDDKDRLQTWKSLRWSEMDGDSIYVVAERYVGGEWLSYDSTTSSTGEGWMEISDLGRDTIRLRAELFSIEGSKPSLLDWTVEWARFPEGVSENSTTPDQLSISIYPNPFNSALHIAAPDKATVNIYDTKGRMIEELGGSRIWNAGDKVPSGVYIVQAKVGDAVMQSKAVLIR